MTLVQNVNLPEDGTSADVADYNGPINKIIAVVNGGITEVNITANSLTSASLDTTDKYTLVTTGTVASGATITPDADSHDVYVVTALAEAATIAAPTGTPTNGQTLLIRITDDGSARALTWNAIYREIGTSLPSTTTAGKTVYIGCVYNSVDAKWDAIAVSEEA